MRIGTQFSSVFKPMRIGEYMYVSLVMETPWVYLILYQEMEKKLSFGNLLWKEYLVVKASVTVVIWKILIAIISGLTILDLEP